MKFTHVIFIQEFFLFYMAKRITIMLEEDIEKKLRQKQAEEIKKTTASVSFSTVINETLRKNLK